MWGPALTGKPLWAPSRTDEYPPRAPMLLSGRLVIQMSDTCWRLSTGIRARISFDSPELDSAITTSQGVTMPKSPCAASPGWTKNDDVPVLANVAAIFRPIWPDLPIPITTTLPVQRKMVSQARVKIFINILIELGQTFTFNVQHLTACPLKVKIRWQIYLRHNVIPNHSTKSGAVQYSIANQSTKPPSSRAPARRPGCCLRRQHSTAKIRLTSSMTP
ncbi:Uncharacterised protein [Klebsiella grimontii]|uniref:Uncharacterized protein n=1 Tax=Klebsiella grimontii TaxID=2058152 RepID=A0A7H4NVX0_9ENTR|nr:Uncharacterised protein [Klebsiella grimontii]